MYVYMYVCLRARERERTCVVAIKSSRPRQRRSASNLQPSTSAAADVGNQLSRNWIKVWIDVVEAAAGEKVVGLLRQL